MTISSKEPPRLWMEKTSLRCGISSNGPRRWSSKSGLAAWYLCPYAYGLSAEKKHLNISFSSQPTQLVLENDQAAINGHPLSRGLNSSWKWIYRWSFLDATHWYCRIPAIKWFPWMNSSIRFVILLLTYIRWVVLFFGHGICSSNGVVSGWDHYESLKKLVLNGYHRYRFLRFSRHVHAARYGHPTPQFC